MEEASGRRWSQNRASVRLAQESRAAPSEGTAEHLLQSRSGRSTV